MAYEGEERRQASSSEIAELKEMVQSLVMELRVHIAKEEETITALKDLVLVWKGSKLIIPALGGLVIAAWAFYEWAKDHLK